eukprot:TRINITY_DN55440_c0_g2_i1.p1 TRINITY_DN55440_c0_g2~~TRINITY_DN55440_c0_g2_i1.p1  ORF type:complete len:521 (-),score=66.21 TRINITY_DN55440_c0_g2_i1:180-1742(-)
MERVEYESPRRQLLVVRNTFLTVEYGDDPDTLRQGRRMAQDDTVVLGSPLVRSPMARQPWTPATPLFTDAFGIASSHGSPARGPEAVVQNPIGALGVGSPLGDPGRQGAEQMRTPSPARNCHSRPGCRLRSVHDDIAATCWAVAHDRQEQNDSIDLAIVESAEQQLTPLPLGCSIDRARRRNVNAELPMRPTQQWPAALSPGLVAPVSGRSAHQTAFHPAISASGAPWRSQIEHGTLPQMSEQPAPRPVLLGRRQDKFEQRDLAGRTLEETTLAPRTEQQAIQAESLELQLEQRLHLAQGVPQEPQARIEQQRSSALYQLQQHLWPQQSQLPRHGQEQQRHPQQPQLQHEQQQPLHQQQHQHQQQQQLQQQMPSLELSQQRQVTEGQGLPPHVSTLMVWGLDRSYTQQFFIADLIASGFGPGKFDILYLPFVLTRRECQGYAVINFKDHQTAIEFFDMCSPSDSKFGRFQSSLRLGIAKHQGRAANLQRLSRVSAKIHNPRFAPLGLTSAGDLAPLSTFR